MEAFHWHLDRHRPTGFAGRLTTRGSRRGALDNCRRRAVPASALDAANAAAHELSNGRIRSYPEVQAGAPPTARAALHARAASGGGGGGGIAATGSIYAHGKAAGSRERGAVGPFYFARGPLVFISRALASRVVAPGSWARAELPAAVASGNETRRELTWPWEDVFLGLAIAHLDGIGGGSSGVGVRGSSDVGGSSKTATAITTTSSSSTASPLFMHLGDEYVTSRWGFCLAASTLVWHMRTKTVGALERIAKAGEWARQHHCAPSSFDVKCAKHPWVGCSPRDDGMGGGGAEGGGGAGVLPVGEGAASTVAQPMQWRPCTTTFARPEAPHTCSDQVQDLLKLFYGRSTSTKCQF